MSEKSDRAHALLRDKCELCFHIDCLKCHVSIYSILLNLTSFSCVYTNGGYSNYSHDTPNLDSILSCTNSYLVFPNCSDDDNNLPNSLL